MGVTILWPLSTSLSAEKDRLICPILCHLAALGLFALVVAGYEVQRSIKTLHISKLTAARDLLIGASVFIAPLLLFVLSSTADKTFTKIAYVWPIPIHKLFTALSTLRSADWLLDFSMLLASAAFVVVVACVGRLSIARNMILPLILLIVAFLALPHEMLGNGFVDTRIPVAILFIGISSTQLKLPTKALHRLVLSGLAIFLVFRCAIISYNWHHYDQVLQEFTNTFASLPPNSLMFVVSEAPKPRFGTFRAVDRWRSPVKHVVSLATLHQSIFVPATWAVKGKQPITIKSRYSAISDFQGFNPLRVATDEELEAVTETIRSLVAVTGSPPVPTFLLGLYPDFLDLQQPNGTRTAGAGRDFLVLQVMAVES